MENFNLNETIADISYLAGNKRYYSGDSRIDMAAFIGWAKEFEELNINTDWEERDYMLEIESFANQKINDIGINIKGI